MNNLSNTTDVTPSQTDPSLSRQLLNKVPEITIFFWIIKILCTTVGETAADFLNVNLNFGLTATSIVTGVLLAVALLFQFRSPKYTPSIYWLAVVLISVFGTLVTDNLTDSLGVPLPFSTIFFSVALVLTFTFWYKAEGTLSIHSIFSKRREAFYWLTILFTFALGTAAGDLMAEGLALGYALTGVIIIGVVGVIAIAWQSGLNPILAFWLIYIMTRPLGASLGDYLAQPQKYGGLGWGATLTSVVFLVAILSVVTYLTVTKRDRITEKAVREGSRVPKNIFVQIGITLVLLLVIGSGGYFWRQAALQVPAVEPSQAVSSASTTVITTPVVATSPLGDVSNFKIITTDTLRLVANGDLAGAATRITDFEHDWDVSAARLKRVNPTKWTEIDDATDLALRQLRSTKPDAAKCTAALNALLGTLN